VIGEAEEVGKSGDKTAGVGSLSYLGLEVVGVACAGGNVRAELS